MENKNELLSIPKEKFIGDNGWVINGIELEYFAEGTNSTVWKYSRMGQKYAFKVFKEGRHSYSLNYKVYEIMKDLPLKNITKPLEGYIKEDVTRSRWLDAYLMDYVDGATVEPVTEISMEHIMANMRNFDYNTELLSDNRIMMFDIGTKNSIIDSDYKINLIDVDMYYISDQYDKDYILQNNRWIMANLFKYYLVKSLEQDADFNNEEISIIKNRLKNYFNFDGFYYENIASKVEGLFGSSERPRQYFLEKKQKI